MPHPPTHPHPPSLGWRKSGMYRSVSALKGCEVNGVNDYGMRWHEYVPPSRPVRCRPRPPKGSILMCALLASPTPPRPIPRAYLFPPYLYWRVAFLSFELQEVAHGIEALEEKLRWFRAPLLLFTVYRFVGWGEH